VGHIQQFQPMAI